MHRFMDELFTDITYGRAVKDTQYSDINIKFLIIYLNNPLIYNICDVLFVDFIMNKHTTWYNKHNK